MLEVQAIKNADQISLVSHLLKMRHSEQMCDLWNVGLNLALRISDLLSIQFSDIRHQRLELKESKTGKHASIALNNKALTIIDAIHKKHPNHRYLFQSFRNQQARNRPPRPLTRRAVAKAFHLVGEETQLHLGTHSMRKTRGYHLYQKTKDIGRVMKMLRQSNEGITLRYIGLTQEEIDQDFVDLEL